MSTEQFDFAVAGNSAFAALLALAMARYANARICLIGQVPTPMQVNGDLALAPCPTSRPDLLERAMAGTTDLRALLTGPGDPLLRRANITFVASTGPGRAAAGHARHLMASFGIVTALLPQTSGHTGFTAEGIWMLRTRPLFASLAARLEAAGVVAAGRAANLRLGEDGVRFAYQDQIAEAKMLIVTDAETVGSLTPLPEGVATATRTAVLTDPVPALAGRVTLDIESGGRLIGRSDGRIEALVPAGNSAKIVDWLGSFLPEGIEARIIARSKRKLLLSRDGAPLIATLPQRAARLAIGFGASGAFLAPALARFLTDQARPEEATWFGAHDADAGRTDVADIGMIGGGRA